MSRMAVGVVRGLRIWIHIITIISIGFLGVFVGNKIIEESNVSAETIIVDINGGADYFNIQDAIDNASNGDTIYVQPGIYYENIKINKTLNLIGAEKQNTTIYGSGNYDVIKIITDLVNISNFTISCKISNESMSGIKLINVNNCTISYINCINNRKGIWLQNSSNNHIFNNICYSNKNQGIDLHGSNNVISNNNCSYSKSSGISIKGINNSIINNQCFSNIGSGIFLEPSKLIIARRNICKLNYGGIDISSCNLTTITSNVFNSNKYGIIISRSCLLTIQNNNCSNNEKGIVIELNSNNNTIKNNSINQNKECGVFIRDSNMNIVTNNTLYNNRNGIDIYSSKKNIVKNNKVTNNEIGISIKYRSNNNILYYNNLISNKRQVDDNGDNIWNNSIREGNYWSDYKGLDNGTNNRIAGNGIGDTKIPHLGLDYYPFVNQSGWLEVNRNQENITEDDQDKISEDDQGLAICSSIRISLFCLIIIFILIPIFMKLIKNKKIK